MKLRLRQINVMLNLSTLRYRPTSCDLVVDLSEFNAHYRPSDRVRLKNANYANFLGKNVRLERPIVQ